MKQSAKKINSDAPILRSPGGVKFRVTAGSKWKFTRAVQRDPRYSKLQKQLLTVLIDMTNEGRNDDESRWGYAYPGYDKLATECGCTRRAVIENITKLEEKAALKVHRSAGQRASGRKGHGGGGGRDNANLYFLCDWTEFGDTENGERETVHAMHCFEETVNGKRETVNGKRETVNGAHGNGEPASPDSSLYPSEKPVSKNTQEHDPAHADRWAGRFDQVPMETPIPADPHGMSQRERFEFLKRVWESSGRRESGEAPAWESFRRLEASRSSCTDFVGILQSIDECRGVHCRPPVDLTGGMSFAEFLNDWLAAIAESDRFEALRQRTKDADLSPQACDMDEPF
ncbi:helix-turn-helix domain-containing protein [Bradyrhizobium manausense]|uniref:helix-turn-helix domain-containing protein n=1 Tax=Bradyrhizobium manausense TaxID=989370 RepID=UPI001BA7F27B|nr:helix-turn-helix domain-containing protein [Bradyrhizobium manausense]MBR0789892.1 helix-turn-helix domain-containing protein [Bradyrhizobium manausense]